MQNTVSQLIYEIGAKLDGSFNTNIRSANTQIETISSSANKADTSLEKLKMQQQDLSKQFMQGKITLSDYRAGLDSIGSQQKALTTFQNLSKEQKNLVQDFSKGKISLEQFTAGMEGANKESGLLSKGLSAVKLAVAGIALFAGQALLSFFKSSVQSASDLNESMSKTAVIFGDASKAIFEFSQTSANGFGISKREALDAASDFAIFGKAAGLTGSDLSDFSIKLVKLSADMASFFNTDTKSAQLAIGAALRGESEPIRRYGILLNETVLKQEVMRLGLGKLDTTLTANQRVLATTSLIYKQTSDAQGDFERTSEGLANSQRILQANFENLKATVGGSFTQSVKLVQAEFGRLLGQLNGSPEQFNKTSKTIYQTTAGLLAFFKTLFGTVKLIVQSIGVFLNLGAVVGSVVVDAFKNGFTAVKSFASGIGNILSGNFKKGFTDIEKSLNAITKPDLSTTTALAERAKNSFVNLAKSVDNTTASIAQSIEVATTGKGFEPVTATQYDNIAKAKTAVDDLGGAVSTSGKKTDEAKKQFEGLAGKILDVQQQAQKATTEIGKNLTEALQKFSETVVSTTAETNQKLAQTVVDAQSKIDEINKKTDRTEEDTKQLAEYQKIVDARVGYEKRSQETIDAIKKKFSDAGIDPATLGLDAQLATQKTFEQQLAETKRIASLDEFTRIEEEGKAKLLKLTEQTLQEVLIIKSKYDKQKEYEADMTAFLQDQSKIQQATVDAFANNAIAKYGEMANSLRNLISLQSQLGSVSAGAKKPQFHDGGFVGAQGGDVHSGEYVLNANMVRNMPNLVSQLEGIRSGRVQNNNINITAGGSSSTDYDEVAQRLAYRLDSI